MKRRDKMHFERLLFLTIIILVLAQSICFGKYSGGTGEPDDPYIIATAEDMNAIGANPADWDKHFLLIADINLADYTGTQFNIIGIFIGWEDPANKPFTGVFDGNGHSISNFTYITPTPSNRIGIFRYVDDPNAEIKNLTLINPDVNASGNLFGISSLVGDLEYGTINCCGIKGGSISGRQAIGGLVGHNGGTITNCYATGSVSGNDVVGGLVGGNFGTIENCYSTGSVSGHFIVGGLVGWNPNGGISQCYSTGRVSGTDSVGGLVGINDDGTVTASFWDIETGGPDNGFGTPLPTEQMQTESTFTDAGWDFIEIWDIGEKQTYPFLRVYLAGDINHDDIVNFYDLAIIANHWLEGL